MSHNLSTYSHKFTLTCLLNLHAGLPIFQVFSRPASRFSLLQVYWIYNFFSTCTFNRHDFPPARLQVSVQSNVSTPCMYLFFYRFVKFCLLRFVNTRKSRLVCTIYVLSCYILKICTYYVCTSNFVNVYKINKENQFRNQNLKKCRIFNCL